MKDTCSFGGMLQVGDVSWDYCLYSVGYRCLRYQYREVALQTAGVSGEVMYSGTRYPD